MPLASPSPLPQTNKMIPSLAHLITEVYLTFLFFLIECGDFAEVRQKYHEAESLQQLFQETSVSYVFDFVREIGLFYRI